MQGTSIRKLQLMSLYSGGSPKRREKGALSREELHRHPPLYDETNGHAVYISDPGSQRRHNTVIIGRQELQRRVTK